MHELARIHWAEEVALHVFAQLLFVRLGEGIRLGVEWNCLVVMVRGKLLG